MMTKEASASRARPSARHASEEQPQRGEGRRSVERARQGAIAETVSECMELMSIDFMETSDEKEEKRRKLLEVLRRRELPRGVMLLLLRVARALQREVRGAAAGMSSDRVEQAYEFLKSLLERHENSKEQSRLEKRFFAACHHRRELLSSRIGSQPGQDGDPARDSIIDEALRDKVDLVLFWHQLIRWQDGDQVVEQEKCAAFIIGVFVAMRDFVAQSGVHQDSLPFAQALAGILKEVEDPEKCRAYIAKGDDAIAQAEQSYVRKTGWAAPPTSSPVDDQSIPVQKLRYFAMESATPIVLVFGFQKGAPRATLPVITVLHQDGRITEAVFENSTTPPEQIAADLQRGIWMVISRGSGRKWHATPAFRWPLDYFLLPMQLSDSSLSIPQKDLASWPKVPTARSSELSEALRSFIKKHHNVELLAATPIQHMDFLGLCLQSGLNFKWITRRWMHVTKIGKLKKILKPACLRIKALLKQRGYEEIAVALYRLVRAVEAPSQMLDVPRGQVEEKEHDPAGNGPARATDGDMAQGLEVGADEAEEEEDNDDEEEGGEDYDPVETDAARVGCNDPGPSITLEGLNPLSPPDRFSWSLEPCSEIPSPPSATGDDPLHSFAAKEILNDTPPFSATTRDPDDEFDRVIDMLAEWDRYDPPAGTSAGGSAVRQEQEQPGRDDSDEGQGKIGPAESQGKIGPAESQGKIGPAESRGKIGPAEGRAEPFRAPNAAPRSEEGSDIQVPPSGTGSTVPRTPLRKKRLRWDKEKGTSGLPTEPPTNRQRTSKEASESGISPLASARSPPLQADSADGSIDRENRAAETPDPSTRKRTQAAASNSASEFIDQPSLGSDNDPDKEQGPHGPPKTGQIESSSSRSQHPWGTAAERASRKRLKQASPSASARSSLHRAAAEGDNGRIQSLLGNAVASVDVVDSDGRTAVYDAVVGGHTSTVRLLLSQHAKADHRDSEKATALHVSAARGREEIAYLLLERGALVDAADKDGRVALHCAALNNCTDVTRPLFYFSANVDAKDSNNQTPLHVACEEGHLPLVQILVDKGADIHAVDKKKAERHQWRTPLHLAARYGHEEIVKFLLDKGAEIDKEKKDGWKPIHQAAKYNHVEVVGTLVERGAAVDTTDRFNWTSLHIAAREGHEETAELLIGQGADLMSVAYDGCTPLHLASYNGNENVVSLLLRKGADPNSVKADGCTPLHLAAWSGHAAVATFLAENGAEVNRRDSRGASPLHLAAFKGHGSVVLGLLDQGADVHARRAGQTPLHLAAVEGHVDVAVALMKRDAAVNSVTQDGSTPLQLASTKGHAHVVSRLLENAADPHLTRHDGSSALHLSCEGGRLEVASLLLQKRVDIEARRHDGKTPLHIASKNNRVGVVSLLLRNGVKIDAEDAEGRTALWLACEAGKTDVVKLLLGSKANVEGSAHAPEGQSPLAIACRNGRTGVVALLLKSGADVETRDVRGQTPICAAASRGWDKIVCQLLKSGAREEELRQSGETDLHIAALLGRIEDVWKLIREGADINAVNKAGATPLAVAVEMNRRGVVAHLAANRATLDTLDFGLGLSPLHRAAIGGKATMVRLLLQLGASVEARTFGGQTALFLAAEQGHAGIVKVLVGRDPALVNVADAEGRTCLWVSAKNGHENVVSLLLEHGADPRATSIDGASVLAVTCGAGHVTIVKMLIGKNADLSAADREDRTPLHLAAGAGHIDVVNALLDEGADSSRTSKRGRTAIGEAIHLGKVDMVRLLHRRGAKLSARTTMMHLACCLGDAGMLERSFREAGETDPAHEGRWSPLDFAAAFDRVDLAEKLLQQGADIHGVDPKKSTPLHTAIHWRRLEAVKLLLDRGADANAKDVNGAAPIHVAAESGRCEILSYLTEKRARVEEQDNHGETALHWSCRTGSYAAASHLLAKRAVVDAASAEGSTPLVLACRFGHKAIARLLVDAGAAIDGLPGAPMTPLQAAASTGCLDVVAFLMGRDADAASVTRDGKTAGQLAAESGHRAVSEFLLASVDELESTLLAKLLASGDVQRLRAVLHSNPSLLDEDLGAGERALHVACRHGLVGMVEELVMCGAKCATACFSTPLHIAASEGHAAVVATLLNRCEDLDVNARDMHGRTALHHAAMHNCVDILQQLVSQEATRVNDVDFEDQTPLLYAARSGHGSAVEVLLRHGADATKADKCQRTPLWWASAHGWSNVVNKLLGVDEPVKRAIVAAASFHGCSPLHAASAKGYGNVVAQLLEAGADTNARNKCGCSPLHMAARGNFADVVEMLLKANADVNCSDETGLTPLHMCARKGLTGMLKRLLSDRRAIATALSTQSKTPLEVAIEHGQPQAVALLHEEDRAGPSRSGELRIQCSLGDVDMVKALLGDADASQTILDLDLLGLAARAGRVGVVEYLLKRSGSLADGAGGRGRHTPLHRACTGGHEDVVKLLLREGADLEAQGPLGVTPLITAAKHGHAAIIALLLSRDANVNAETLRGTTALYAAAACGQTSAVAELVRRGADPCKAKANGARPLHVAIQHSHEDIVGLLLENAGDVESEMEQWWRLTSGLALRQRAVSLPPAMASWRSFKCRPLHLAACSGHEGVVECLLNKGAKIEAVGRQGMTAMHFAVEAGHTSVARLLLARGADVNRAYGEEAAEEVQGGAGLLRSDRATAMHLAVRNEDTQMAELLIRFGANLEARDGCRRTPLGFAVDLGKVTMVTCLLQHGAACYRSHVRLAEQNRRVDICDLLREHAQAEASSSGETASECETESTSSRSDTGSYVAEVIWEEEDGLPRLQEDSDIAAPSEPMGLFPATRAERAVGHARRQDMLARFHVLHRSLSESDLLSARRLDELAPSVDGGSVYAMQSGGGEKGRGQASSRKRRYEEIAPRPSNSSPEFNGQAMARTELHRDPSSLMSVIQNLQQHRGPSSQEVLPAELQSICSGIRSSRFPPALKQDLAIALIAMDVNPDSVSSVDPGLRQCILQQLEYYLKRWGPAAEESQPPAPEDDGTAAGRPERRQGPAPRTEETPGLHSPGCREE